MATDAPSGDLESDDEPWDAQRVRERDERIEHSGRTKLFAAAEHMPTGKLVALTDLSVPADHVRPVEQGITLVLREHRGHRLGMIIKVANIQALQAFSPHSPCILTENAEENHFMIQVNEAVGFTPIGYSGVWKKTLA
jgi:hypothetical protein